MPATIVICICSIVLIAIHFALESKKNTAPNIIPLPSQNHPNKIAS